jgi:cell division protein FtsB
MKKKKDKSIILRVLVLCVSVYLIYSLSSLWTELAEGKKRLDEYNQQIAETEQKIEEYKILLEDGNEKEIIEKAARDRLGYVFADEQVYIDVSGN